MSVRNEIFIDENEKLSGSKPIISKEPSHESISDSNESYSVSIDDLD